MEQGDKRKECCKQPENLVREQIRPDLSVDVCKVCGCRHFELSIDPVKLGIKGGNIGG